MNVHNDVENWVEPYLTEGLSPAEREEVDRHMQTCAACVTVLSDAREFARFIFASLESWRAPADLEERVVRGLRREGVRSRRRFLSIEKLHVPGWTRIAALVLLFIGVGVLVQPVGLYSVGAARRAAQQATAPREEGRRLQERSDKTRLGVELRKAEEPNEMAEAEDFDEASRGDRGVFKSKGYSGGIGGGGGGRLNRRMPVENLLGGKEVLAVEKASAPASTVAADYQDRKIVKSGSLDFEVDSFENAYQRIVEIAREDSGFVASSSTQKLPNGKVRGQVVIRVPAEKFDAVVLKLRALGDLKNQSISTQDVTKHYVDLDSRLRSKRTLEERLIKILKEGKGEIKHLLEVERELGKVREEIEQIQGELKYYDNLISLSTLTLSLAERDIEQPFEYVQTLQAKVDVTVDDADAAYAKTHDIVKEIKGHILDARMTRQQDGSAKGFIKASVDAEKFPGVLEDLKKLGTPTEATVTQQQQPIGGKEGKGSPDAPVRKEQAVMDLTLSTPPRVVTLNGDVSVETPEAAGAYEAARKAVQDAGGKILDGGMTHHVDGSSGTLKVEVDASKFSGLVDTLKRLGKVKTATVKQQEPPKGIEIRRELGRLEVSVMTPGRLVQSEEGIGAALRKSVRGLVFSLQMLVVGAAYAGPWLLVALLVLFLIRRARKRRASAQQA